MRPASALPLILWCALTIPSTGLGEEIKPASFRLFGGFTATYFAVSHAYFGAAGQPGGGGHGDYFWLESMANLRGELALGAHFRALLGIHGMATLGRDYYGLDDSRELIVDRAELGVTDIGGSGLSLTLGRQDLQIGDGFIIGDGYFETKATLWSIPLSFFDALRADYSAGPFHATALLARLDDSFPAPCEWCEPQEGSLAGLDLAWQSERWSAAMGHFRRNDHAEVGNDGAITAVRGALKLGPVTLAGEYGRESGALDQVGGENAVSRVDLAGEAFHLDVTWELPAGRDTYVKGSYLAFSGDDPGTREWEQYSRWNYRWNDWNRYYIGDIIGSQFLFNQDERVIMLEGGLAPGETTRLRLFLLRTRLDTGSALGGLPPGVSKDFSDEIMVVLDYAPRPNLSTWVLLAWARPRGAARALIGSDDCAEVLTSLSVIF
ncbi:MAG: hypothetical protein V1750_06320 [Acidobacteriota bacterium]